MHAGRRAAGAVLGLAALAAATSAAQPPAANASIRITRFSGLEARGAAAAVAGDAAGSSAGARIDLGEEIALAWSVEVCGAQAVRIDLEGFGEQPAGDRRALPDGCYAVVGRRTLRPERTTLYRLTAARAAGVPGPASALFRVQVARPVLEAAEPTIDQRSLRVTFRVRNRGDGDLRPSRVDVTYRIWGVARGGAPLITEGSLRADRLAIPSGQTADAGAITLPDRSVAFSFDDVVLDVRVKPFHAPELEAANGSFPHRWVPGTFTLTQAMLAGLGRASRCAIRLNNYDPARAPEPVAANDSSVLLSLGGAGAEVRFDVPPTRAAARTPGAAGAAERRYGILVNRILAELPGRADFFAIRDGQIAFRLDLQNAGGPEVKIGELAGGTFQDAGAPDVETGPIAAEVMLAPGISGDSTRLTLARWSVRVSPIPVRLPVGFEALDRPVRDTLDGPVKRSLGSGLDGILRRPDLRRGFEDGLAALLAPLGVVVIRRVEGRGGSIVVTYL